MLAATGGAGPGYVEWCRSWLISLGAMLVLSTALIRASLARKRVAAKEVAAPRAQPRAAVEGPLEVAGASPEREGLTLVLGVLSIASSSRSTCSRSPSPYRSPRRRGGCGTRAEASGAPSGADVIAEHWRGDQRVSRPYPLRCRSTVKGPVVRARGRRLG